MTLDITAEKVSSSIMLMYPYTKTIAQTTNKNVASYYTLT